MNLKAIEGHIWSLNKKSTFYLITHFIKSLRKHPFITLETNGMSTQVFGDYDNVMSAINNEMKNNFLMQNKVVFNMKVINAHLQEKPSF